MNKKFKTETHLPYTKSEEIQALEVELTELHSKLKETGISIYDLGINSDGGPLRTLIELRIYFNEIITMVRRHETMLGGICKIEIELLKAFLNKTV